MSAIDCTISGLSGQLSPDELPNFIGASDSDRVGLSTFHISPREGEPQPPAGNTGVLSTSKFLTEGIVLDWLSFTVAYSPDAFIALRGLLGDMVERGMGYRGYSCSASILSTGLVGWSPERPEQKIYVSLPASALTLLDYEALELLQKVVDLAGSSVRRIDLALDDFEGLLDLVKIEQILDDPDGPVVTRWRDHEPKKGKRKIGGGGATSGFTIEVGSRTSESFLRFYDKRLEQMAKGVEPEKLPERWVRCELETKKDRAHELAKSLLGAADPQLGVGLGEYVRGYLLGKIDFKEPPAGEEGDTNRSRWKTVRWWSDFLGTEKFRFSMPKEPPTLEAFKTWFRKSVAPIASVIMSTVGRDGERGDEWLLAAIAAGWDRLGPRHKYVLKTSGVPV